MTDMVFDPEAAKRRIEATGRTRKWLASFCGIEVESLNHILAGRRQPGSPVLKLLAMALECPVESLAETINTKAPEERKAATG